MKDMFENEENIISIDYNSRSLDEQTLIDRFKDAKKQRGWEIIDSSSEYYKEARDFVYGGPHSGANCYDALMKEGDKIYFYELKTNNSKKSKDSTGWNRVTFNELKLAYNCEKSKRFVHRFVIGWSPTGSGKLYFKEFQLSDFRQFFSGKHSLAFDINFSFNKDVVRPSKTTSNEITSNKIISSSNQLPNDIKIIGEIFKKSAK